MYLENTINHKNVYEYNEDMSKYSSYIHAKVESSVYPDKTRYAGYTEQVIRIYSDDTRHAIVMTFYHNYRIFHDKENSYILRMSTDIGRNKISTNYLYDKGFDAFFQYLFKIYNQYDYMMKKYCNFEEAVVDIDLYTNRYYTSSAMELFKHFFILFEYMDMYSMYYAQLEENKICFKLVNLIDKAEKKCILYLPEFSSFESKPVNGTRYKILVNQYVKNKFTSEKDDVFVTKDNNTDISVLLSKNDENHILKVIEEI